MDALETQPLGSAEGDALAGSLINKFSLLDGSVKTNKWQEMHMSSYHCFHVALIACMMLY